MRRITNKTVEAFREHLISAEKSSVTVGKYLHDVGVFKIWLGRQKLCKETVLSYKLHLCEGCAPTSVNVALSSLNSFFKFMNWYDLCVKKLKIQRQIFQSSNKELTKSEYERLLQAAKEKKNERLYLLMQTVCSTGIRISELRYITVEAIGRGVAEVNGKGKRRRVFLPRQLCLRLRSYIKEKK